MAFRGKETTIVDRLKQNLAVVRQTEQELPGLVSAVAKSDFASSRESKGKVFELEAKTSGAAKISWEIFGPKRPSNSRPATRT